MELSLSPSPSAPYSLFKHREDPAYPKLSWAAGTQAQWIFGRSGSPKVPLEEASAAGCLPGAAGYEVKEWTKATAQLLQWPSAILICNRNAPSGHAPGSTCFPGYLQHHMHTYDTELAHTVQAHTAHEASELHSSPAAAPHPGSTATRCAHQGMLHGYGNQIPHGRIASNLNFRDGQKNPVSPHLKELVFSDITAIKLQWKPY